MTRRTRRLLLFGLPAALLASAIAAALLWPRTAITRENAARIQVGMTLTQVEAILAGRRGTRRRGRWSPMWKRMGRPA
jgi:hypothetical protein